MQAGKEGLQATLAGCCDLVLLHSFIPALFYHRVILNASKNVNPFAGAGWDAANLGSEWLQRVVLGFGGSPRIYAGEDALTDIREALRKRSRLVLSALALGRSNSRG